MSLDMIGEWILILLGCKSGKIERLLLRFCDENQAETSVAMCYYRHRKKRVKLCCCGIQAALRGQGEPRSDRGQSVDPSPLAKTFFTSRSAVVNGVL